eukprot:9504116-Pyramimonas_sp.AAC.1
MAHRAVPETWGRARRNLSSRCSLDAFASEYDQSRNLRISQNGYGWGGGGGGWKVGPPPIRVASERWPDASANAPPEHRDPPPPALCMSPMSPMTIACPSCRLSHVGPTRHTVTMGLVNSDRPARHMGPMGRICCLSPVRLMGGAGPMAPASPMTQ